ncbi:hypothetical protein GH15_190 [Staphylococcus phage G15]|uniref:Uncharacterized protein n=1 Tax=Staphylococcus phage G15 TaxID=760530 RepID=I6PC55_BPG15|nr:hypothetical protein F360_gp190 [Staphylococcus phage G15]AFF28662.1 hypothetical protein GH15_190 [Staphylococcus phage G15]
MESIDLSVMSIITRKQKSLLYPNLSRKYL